VLALSKAINQKYRLFKNMALLKECQIKIKNLSYIKDLPDINLLLKSI
jgi:hypothetical protein